MLLLGGLAVIHHGLSRLTKDADVWLDPLDSPKAWSDVLLGLLPGFPESYLWDLSRRTRIPPDELAEVIEAVGVIRVGGLESDLDVFRRPNNLQLTDFDQAWSDSVPIGEEPFRVMDDVDLIVTKENTPRESDRQDITFLEGRIRGRLAPLLAQCPPEQARAVFARYADHVTCEAALKNPHPEVRALAIETLREFAAAQNPFAREILQGLGEAPPARSGDL